jgi:hypothetical protein
MYFEGFSSTPHVLTNCLMTENQALITDLSDPNEPIIGGDGGAISSNLGAWLQLTNCTISGNEAFSGGGLICAEEWAWVELFSSILWDNEAPYGPQIAVRFYF